MGVVKTIPLSVFVLGTAVLASDVKGTILIEKKLTRRNVTNAAGAYQRGTAVDLGGATEDPLEFERSHVAIYVEGSASNLTPIADLAGEIQQTHREFEPDFLVIPAGSTVSFPNFDPIFHNVFSLSRTKTFDLGNYPRTNANGDIHAPRHRVRELPPAP